MSIDRTDFERCFYDNKRLRVRSEMTPEIKDSVAGLAQCLMCS